VLRGAAARKRSSEHAQRDLRYARKWRCAIALLRVRDARRDVDGARMRRIRCEYARCTHARARWRSAPQEKVSCCATASALFYAMSFAMPRCARYARMRVTIFPAAFTTDLLEVIPLRRLSPRRRRRREDAAADAFR